MGKKSSQAPMKIPKREKKQHLNSLIKILRPKVYIKDSSNFKGIVQEITGNGKYSPPPPSTCVSLSPPTWDVPFAEAENHHHLAYKENRSLESSFNSSCFATHMEGPQDSSTTGSLSCELENSLDRQKMEFFKDLGTTFMEMDSGNRDHDAYYGMFQQDDVGVYIDYDSSNFM